MSEPTCTITLTRSQQMALLDILAERMRDQKAIHRFLNFSTSPPTQTEDTELFALVMNAWFCG
jgi:hypothetical protein